jgi:pyruvate formate lyase activating enzyme
MLFFSGGGVTFTGGEATVQYDELFSLLSRLRAAGIHTAIETNGTSARLGELLSEVDYLMMDFKHFDDGRLRAVTGVGNAVIKQNYEQNCLRGRQQHIRIPLIGGFNADNPRGFAEYFAGHNTENTVFEFLPYHEYGKGKWTEEYRVTNGFVTKETVAEFQRVFQESGLTVVTT